MTVDMLSTLLVKLMFEITHFFGVCTRKMIQAPESTYVLAYLNPFHFKLCVMF
jgi:hypothetical protein